MKASIQLLNPDQQPVRIEVLMTVGEARALKDQLAEKYPAWRFARILSAAIQKATEQFDQVENVDP